MSVQGKSNIIWNMEYKKFDEKGNRIKKLAKLNMDYTDNWDKEGKYGCYITT